MTRVGVRSLETRVRRRVEVSRKVDGEVTVVRVLFADLGGVGRYYQSTGITSQFYKYIK